MAVLCTGDIIYHQTMTPFWLEAHASYIDSSHTTTNEQITFNAGTIKHAALLKVPMIPPGSLRHNTPLTVQITVANDVSIGTSHESDNRYGVSDGTSFIGFHIPDKASYVNRPPCYGVEGPSGSSLLRLKYINRASRRASDSFYPGQFVITLKIDERWGSCYTLHDGGYTNSGVFSNRLELSKGLTLEVYKDEANERVGIKYIKVSIIEDA
ncbi:hypothetical protein ACROYT_G031462 [Oculina patagonica]